MNLSSSLSVSSRSSASVTRVPRRPPRAPPWRRLQPSVTRISVRRVFGKLRQCQTRHCKPPAVSDPGATLESMSPTRRYIGSGPYCYANSLAMVLGPHAPDPSAPEVLTGSPFGFEMLEGTLPLFDPLGWEPDTGLDDAIARLGWTCERHDGGGPDEAVDRLREASAAAPVLAGPVE